MQPPPAITSSPPATGRVGLIPLFTRIYNSTFASSVIDAAEQEYVRCGEAFFHVSARGHENIAFLQPHLEARDFLHCHYRDKALMLERGMAPREFFLSLFCKDQSHSRGRQMSAHLSSPPLHILSIVGPVGNNVLQAAGIASILKRESPGALVYCGMGEGSSQQGGVLEAIAQAVRDVLPVLFVVQDNSYAISTRTEGQTFFSRPDGLSKDFYGIPLEYIDGRNALAAYDAFGRVVRSIRATSGPRIVVFKVERLDSHTNADDQSVYRTSEAVQQARETSDPVINLRNYLNSSGVPEKELLLIEQRIRAKVKSAAEEALTSPEPAAFAPAKAVIQPVLENRAAEYTGSTLPGKGCTMLQAIRGVLENHLREDCRVTLFGEDIEDPKGDVFGVTKGLSTTFPGRVKNAPLAESTIVGHSIGQALAGARPVCFLQFADFLPIAFNQIWSELASLFWRTDGGWRAPVIVMVTCGGYKPGLGPFHASSMESLVVHTPGLDVFCPSSAGDAAGLLNAAFQSERPTIFFYPKSLLNDRDRTTSEDLNRHLVPIGKARVLRTGSDISLVGWGNLMPILERVADSLLAAGKQADVLDLRSLSPWDQEAVLSSAEKTGKLLIAQEDVGTASMASEIAATVSERCSRRISIRRVSRGETYVPCNFANQLEILPSYKLAMEAAVDLLGGKIEWSRKEEDSGGVFVESIGTSPADESVTVIEWKVKPGDLVIKGSILAELEADKAAFELASPVTGKVEAVLIPEQQMVRVGTPLLEIIPDGIKKKGRKPLLREVIPEARIEFRSPSLPQSSSLIQAKGITANTAGIAAITSKLGSRKVTNEDISSLCSEWEPEEISRRIGIRNRYWANEDESAVTLAAEAAKKLLEQTGLDVKDLDLVLVATGSPPAITPSVACLVLEALCRDRPSSTNAAAVDINAACSGYLYGLQYAHDFLLARPNGRVLLITTEVLSKLLDTSDPQTAPIFGDAATATLLVGAGRHAEALLNLKRPVLGAKGETGEVLSLPRDPSGHIRMIGTKVYQEAVRSMISSLQAACTEGDVALDDLDLVVAHQANQRILDAVGDKVGLAKEKIFSAIADFGNTSSSSIPLCLERLLLNKPTHGTWALCSFGGGFTFGGAILEVHNPDFRNISAQR